MASGEGSYGDYGKGAFVQGLVNGFNKGYLYNGTTNTVMSDTLAITWLGGGANEDFREMNVSGGPKVFTISQTGTVNQLFILNSSNVLQAVIDLTPVVYSTPTYYTLSELIIYFN